MSVLMITFNQERFIGQAIESALMQEGSFSYEIVIGDDDSSDKTREIASNLQRNNPDNLRLLSPTNRLGANRNLIRTLESCRGQYIALLEGDDYWTSPYKLLKQVEFLDSHPECSMCFHNVRIVYEDRSQEPRDYNAIDQKPISTIEDLWARNFMATCSVMFRAGLVTRFPDWYYEAKWGDWPLHILNADHGNIGYLDEIMGVYRVHSEGLFSKLSETEKLEEMIEFYEDMNAGFGFRYNRSIKAAISTRCLMLARKYDRAGQLARARTYAIRYVRETLSNGRMPTGLQSRWVLMLCSPRLYGYLKAVWGYLRTAIGYSSPVK